MKRAIIAVCLVAVVVSLLSIFTKIEEMENAAQKEPKIPTVEAAVCTAADVVVEKIVVEHEPPLYDVPLDNKIQRHITQSCEVHHIDPSIVIAMIKRESNYNVSNVGDNGNSFGLMQIQPRWHYQRMQELGCTDLFDPYQNILVGIDYLAELLDRYGSIDKALTAYNRGSYSGVVTDYAKNVIETAGTLKKKGAK